MLANVALVTDLMTQRMSNIIQNKGWNAGISNKTWVVIGFFKDNFNGVRVNNEQNNMKTTCAQLDCSEMYTQYTKQQSERERESTKKERMIIKI